MNPSTGSTGNTAPRRSFQRQAIDGVVYKIAGTREEREDAFRLIHDANCFSKRTEPSPCGMRVTPYHLLPTTDIFVAYHGSKLIYTMTLISDDALGLPLEQEYAPEVAELRQQTGSYYAEVACLASQQKHASKRVMYEIFQQLAGLMVQSARENGIEKLVIACRPCHLRFYQSFLGFEPIGAYDPAQPDPDAPIACEHDFARLDRERYKLHDRIYAHSFRHWELYHQPMLKEDRAYFAEIAEMCESCLPLEGVA